MTDNDKLITYYIQDMQVHDDQTIDVEKYDSLIDLLRDKDDYKDLGFVLAGLSYGSTLADTNAVFEIKLAESETTKLINLIESIVGPFYLKLQVFENDTLIEKYWSHGTPR